MDQCTHCVCYGDMGSCLKTECDLRENWSFKAIHAHDADREAKIRAVCYALESAVDALSDYQRVDMYDKDLENAKEVLGVVK